MDINVLTEIGLVGLYYKLHVTCKDGYYTFYNTDRNMAIFASIDYDGDISDVFNATADEPYDRLISFMNDNSDFVVYWYKTEGTTSDYTICLDHAYEYGLEAKDVVDYICKVKENSWSSYKYDVVEDGQVSQFR